ncbi:MAG TPA: hypothetical protein VJY54_04480 [Lachnospiraceae bacterium]|nr:hypothetical protein [Lachnospiraceae bacterium]
MRKLIFITAMTILISALAGCGVKKNTDTSQAQGDVQGVENLNTDAITPNSAFQITLNGDNETVFTLTHEAVGKLESIQDGDTWKSVNEIYVDLFSDNGEDSISISIREDNFYICEWISDEASWYYDSHNDGQVQPEWNGNTVIAKVNHLGIADTVNKYTEYRVVLFNLESRENETLEEGKVADIISTGDIDLQTLNSLQIVIYDNNTVKFKIYGEEAKAGFYNYKNIYIRLYQESKHENGEKQSPTIEFRQEQFNVDTGRGKVWALSFTKEDDGMVYGHNLSDNDLNGVSAAADYGVAMKYEGEGISNDVKNTSEYEVYVGDDLLCMGHVDDAIIENEFDTVPSIPGEFRSGDTDDNCFVPTTDNYKVLEVTFRDHQFGTAGWYQRMGTWVYGAEEPYFNEDVKVIYLISFDEIGIADSKMKIVYESSEGLLSDLFINFPQYIIAEALTGVNEPDDSIITTEFVESIDKEVFDFTANESNGFTYEYLGHSDNARYYCYEHVWGTGELPTIVSWGFYGNMKYTDFQYISNEIMEEMWDEYPIRTYSSKADSSYEEEAAQYNTAPVDWHDHPYASYLPELPQGMTVDYAPRNDEELNLGTNCTREQALEFIGNMRRIEHTEIRHKTESDEEIVYIIGVGDGIYIGANWRSDFQHMSIFGYRE